MLDILWHLTFIERNCNFYWKTLIVFIRSTKSKKIVLPNLKNFLQLALAPPSHSDMSHVQPKAWRFDDKFDILKEGGDFEKRANANDVARCNVANDVVRCNVANDVARCDEANNIARPDDANAVARSNDANDVSRCNDANKGQS